MVTLLYGIATIQKLIIFIFGAWVGIVFYRAYLRIKHKEEQESLDKSWHAIEDELENGSKKLSPEQEIIIAIEKEDYEKAAELRDKLKEK